MEENKEEVKPNPDLAKLVSMFYLRSATTLKHEYDHPGGAYQRVSSKTSGSRRWTTGTSALIWVACG
jgi:hypothetical protein